MNRKHLGSNLDDFLAEERILDIAQATAAKRVIAFQIAQEMKHSRSMKKRATSYRLQKAVTRVCYALRGNP